MFTSVAHTTLELTTVTDDAIEAAIVKPEAACASASFRSTAEPAVAVVDIDPLAFSRCCPCRVHRARCGAEPMVTQLLVQLAQKFRVQTIAQCAVETKAI